MQGGSYGLMATGDVFASPHSNSLPGTGSIDDPYGDAAYSTYDNVEFKMEMVVPEDAAGLEVDFIFMSAEYEEFIGENYNDKFYIFSPGEASTGGEKVVINTSLCRDPDAYYDTLGEDGEERCYIAINSAFSEPCTPPDESNPDGPISFAAQTDISGTGFECPYPFIDPALGGLRTEAVPVGSRPDGPWNPETPLS